MKRREEREGGDVGREDGVGEGRDWKGGDGSEGGRKGGEGMEEGGKAMEEGRKQGNRNGSDGAEGSGGRGAANLKLSNYCNEYIIYCIIVYSIILHYNML